MNLKYFHIMRLEWWRSLFTAKQNKDFLWFTLLMTLTFVLVLLLWGAREGLLNKFIDISIGYVKDKGIPIWIAADKSRGFNKEELRKYPDLFPYREIEENKLTFPGNLQDNKNKRPWTEKTASLTGWAIAYDDPLWQQKKPKPKDLLHPTIILNESLFKQNFSCKNYVDFLKTELPFTVKELKKSAAPLYCLTQNNTIWLDVKLAHGRELIPFDIIWRPQIPTMGKIAFLFPDGLSSMLSMGTYFTDMAYYPVDVTKQNRFVKSFTIWHDGKKITTTAIDKLVTCLPKATRTDSDIELKKSVPFFYLEKCNQFTLKLTIQKDPNNRLQEPYIALTNAPLSQYQYSYHSEKRILTVSCRDNKKCKPCNKMPIIEQTMGNQAQCFDHKVDLSIFYIGGYHKAFMYAKNRADLKTKTNEITKDQASGKSIFSIHPTYEDALIRYQFIDKIMSILKDTSTVFFLFFISFLLWVQVSIVISHRKHNYGILLAKGISWWKIGSGLFTQIIFSFVCSLLIAIGITEIAQWCLAKELQQVVSNPPFVEQINAGKIDLLPLSYPDYLLIGGLIFSLLLIITLLIFSWEIIRKSKEPARLFE